jgi:diguanylate cyclase (GGDEF)-like protein
MTWAAHDRVLLVGDRDQSLTTVLSQAVPAMPLVQAPNVFDAIAELHAGRFSAVLAPLEPIERRPEPAVRVLRELAGGAQLVLFGHPTLEPLARKMMDFGVDDYFVTPPSPTELRQIFQQPRLRVAEPPADEPEGIIAAASLTERLSTLTGLPLGEIVLDALLQHPQAALATAVGQINARIGPTLRLVHDAPGQSPPSVADGMVALSHPVRTDTGPAGTLHLLLPRDEDEASARHALAQLALLLGRCAALDERHRRLQKLAITDDLTGVYNARWFRHFLDRILDRARQRRFPVTLLLFDIDNFKHYNDQFGHGVGDEILRQTAVLMKRCSRDHDLVARIAGDEFAVVFWDNEPPRVPRDPTATTVARVPQTPLQIAERFRRMIQSNEFTALGPQGQGRLTISGGMAVYPYDAQTPQDLIEAADRALMFGAKKGGKNSIYLVGDASDEGGGPS